MTKLTLKNKLHLKTNSPAPHHSQDARFLRLGAPRSLHILFPKNSFDTATPK